MEDRERFERLYRAHAGAVRTYACRRSDAGVADEVVADVFLVAWRRLDDVPDDPLAWLLGVARRVLANRRRAVAREQALRGRMLFERASRPAWSEPVEPGRAELADSGRAELAGSGWAAGGDDLDETVLAALTRIAEADREALLLVAWEGLTPGQAAAALGLAPNTFSARLSRAKRRFQRALADERARQRPTPTTIQQEVPR